MTDVDTFQRTSAAVLGWGSIAFAGWALAQPRGFAHFMGTDPATARLTGMRDLAIGGALIARGDRWAFVARASADAWDAATVAKPNIARGAAGFCLWAATAALLAGRGPAMRRFR
jgi:hypothetical protein